MTTPQLSANQASIREVVEAGLLSGAVTMVWQHGQVLQLNEIGYRDVGAGTPMQRDTVFRIASMSKPVTTAAAMTLIDEGKLALHDPVTRWLPEFAEMRVLRDRGGPLDDTVPACRTITVDDLLTHRSGLAYAFSVTGPLSQAYLRLPVRRHPDTWLGELTALPLVHQPGERMTYSHATDVLGIMLSRIEGKELHEVLAERIFGPLGMHDTGFFVTPEGRRRAATMYKLDDDGRLCHDVMGPPPIAPHAFCLGGGGLWSTADDYLRFARMLLAGGAGVLSAEAVRLMRTNRLTDAQRRQPFLGAPYWVGRGFGLGLSVVMDPAESGPLFGPGGVGTFGWPGAYGTWWQADPTRELILIYLVQNHPTLSADAAAAVAGNTSQAKLMSALPRFVRRTYQALAD
ncbi:MAG: beta-lactamase family protein [Mycobacteriaceae bacterium]|nr:beta-lactamase family protein [Mycobacteriaceae bacterium]